MSVMSMEESQEEEHSNIFFQLLLDYLRFSAIGKTCFMSDEASAVAVHNFVSEQLNLTKEVILNAKKVESFSSEILRLRKWLLTLLFVYAKSTLQQWIRT